jgi:hypothetical protein
MNTELRTEVHDYMRACGTLLELADQRLLTIEECDAVISCSRELEKKAAAATLSNFPPTD